MTTTILARDLKRDDVIDFGGQPVTVDQEPFGVHTEKGVRHTYVSWTLGGGWFPEDLPLNVQRPDPDAELVEVMARGMTAIAWKYVSDEVQCEYRGKARAALTAAREAGLL